MKINDFIKENRAEIDYYIYQKEPCKHLDNKRRKRWILVDENLTNWAMALGVDIDKMAKAKRKRG